MRKKNPSPIIYFTSNKKCKLVMIVEDGPHLLIEHDEGPKSMMEVVLTEDLLGTIEGDEDDLEVLFLLSDLVDSILNRNAKVEDFDIVFKEIKN